MRYYWKPNFRPYVKSLGISVSDNEDIETLLKRLESESPNSIIRIINNLLLNHQFQRDCFSNKQIENRLILDIRDDFYSLLQQDGYKIENDQIILDNNSNVIDTQIQENFLMAYESNFFFVDIVGLSQPDTFTEDQIQKINILNQSIANCKTFTSIDKSQLIIIPTGDGVALGFPNPNAPFDLAVELHKKLREYNSEKKPYEQIKIRIGINNAEYMKIKDLSGKENIWGDGIILSRRIMDAGQADHILLGSRSAESLIRLSEKYKDNIYSLGPVEFKHGREDFLYYAFGEGFGNNETSSISGLKNKNTEFEAKILEKTTFQRGDLLRVQVHFKGNLTGGFFDNMIRAPEGKKFPYGGNNWWCVDPKSAPDDSKKPGKLIGSVDVTHEWGCRIKENYPTGKYKVFIRVYDHLKPGQRPIIREKVETIDVVK